MDVVVHPRFGDSARVAVDDGERPQLVVDIGTGSLVVRLDGGPGSIELAASFADSLADAALEFAARCRERLGANAVAID